MPTADVGMWYDAAELDGIDVAVIAAAVATIVELFCITDVFDIMVDEADDCDLMVNGRCKKMLMQNNMNETNWID